MYQELFQNANFWSFLFSIDEELAKACKEEGRPCGGTLHCANYPRKPRGAPIKLPPEYRFRFSFCCDREGCRKRKTPPSVRFLGRKVYLAAVVILVSAMRQGPHPQRIRELTNRFGVDRQTIDRWRIFWNELFPHTKFWQVQRGRLVPICQISALPLSLLQAFVQQGKERLGWGNLLRFLAPLTITGGLAIAVSAASCDTS